jgi:hypothetical protein
MRICIRPQNARLAHPYFMIILYWKRLAFHDHFVLDNSPFDALEVNAYNLLHSLLPFARRIDQMPISLDEEIQAIGPECLIDERTINLELLLDVVERGADLRKLHAVAPTNRG